MKLSRSERNALLRKAYAYRRKAGPYTDPVEIADHIVGDLFDDERFEDVPATEISDYAYGIALFVVPRSEGW